MPGGRPRQTALYVPSWRNSYPPIGFHEGYACGHLPTHQLPVEPILRKASACVAKMLRGIEQELDNVEMTIGDDRLKLIDVDRDGLVSRQELQAAVSFLKTQLDPADLELLFQKLGAAAADPHVPIKVEELLVLAAENREAAAAAEAGTGGSKSPKKEKADKGGEGAQEVVKIYTM